jgi:hypothetical protein
MMEEELKDLRRRAEEASDLIDTMNKTFRQYPKENTILVLMATIRDAYIRGQVDERIKYKDT